AAFDDTSGAVKPFSAPISQNGGDATVFALAASGSTVYVGGNFTAPRPLLAALDGMTGAVTSTSPDLFGAVVLALGVSASRGLATGRFSAANGVARNHLAAIDLTSGQATAWDPDVDGTVSVLAVSGSTIYAGGSFATVNSGTPQAGLAAFDAASGARTVSPTTNGPVDTIAPSGATVYVGGNFDTLDGTVTRSLVAAFGADTDAVTAFGPGFDMFAYQPGLQVSAPAAMGSTVYLGGTFTSVSALVRHRIAAVQDLPGLVGVLTPFDPDVDGQVSALALSGSTVYAGGAFTSVRGGTPRHHLAAFGDMTGDVTPWDPDLNGVVFAFALSDPILYVGGHFTAGNGAIPRHRRAAIDTGTGDAMSWDPDADGAVRTIALSPTAGLVVGGDFTTLGGGLRPQPGFAAFALPPGAPTDAAATA